MRLCVEVKDPRGEPIRLIVEFLRIWYDQSGVEVRLQCLPPDAETDRRYLRAALEAFRPEIPSPIITALNRDLEAARATGDAEQAVRVLVELGAQADTVLRCLVVAGELRGLGRYAEALTVCERAVERDPTNPTAWNNMGVVLSELGRNADALTTREWAIELDPKDAIVWSNKGVTLYELCRYAKALAACDRAIELDPKDDNPWGTKGNALYLLGRQTEALAAYDRAIDLKPDEAHAWNNKGYALTGLGRHVEALAVCNRAIELARTCAYAWKNRGRDKVGLGQVRAGVDAFRPAIELNGYYLPALASLAEAYVLHGDWAEPAQTL